MSELEASAAAAEGTGERALDPFGFHHGHTSRIAGLGGNAPGHDPSYAFHTPYVAVARGPARFRIRFDDLTARRGTLVLRVHMLPDEPGAIARLVNSTRVQLNRLVQMGGEIEIEFEGYRGFTFAVLGQVSDETDARAHGLTVTLDRPADSTAVEAGPREDIRTTRFGSDALRPIAQMLTIARPSLAAPVSQPCTAEQLAEPLWAARCADLRLAPARDPRWWPAVFSLQVLRVYGMLAPGARGLLFGSDDALASAVRAGGDEVVSAAPDGDDGAAAIGETRFDYLCSKVALHRRAGVGEMEAEIERTLSHVRPGGLAIHLLPIAGGTRGRGADAPGFRRADLERLALTLISKRHEVAQIAPGGTVVADAEGVLAFGLVFRRARSPL